MTARLVSLALAVCAAGCGGPATEARSEAAKPSAAVRPAATPPPAHTVGVTAAPGDRRSSQGSLALPEYDREGVLLWYARPSPARVEAAASKPPAPLALFDGEITIELAITDLLRESEGGRFDGYELAIAIDRERGIYEASSQLQYPERGPWRLDKVKEGTHRGLLAVIVSQWAPTSGGRRLLRVVALLGDEHEHAAIGAVFYLDLDQNVRELLVREVMARLPTFDWQRSRPIEPPKTALGFTSGLQHGINIEIARDGTCSLAWPQQQKSLPAGSRCEQVVPFLKAAVAAGERMALVVVHYPVPQTTVARVEAIIRDAGMKMLGFTPRVEVVVFGRDEVSVAGSKRLRGGAAFRELVRIRRDEPKAQFVVLAGKGASPHHLERVTLAVTRAEKAAADGG